MKKLPFIIVIALALVLGCLVGWQGGIRSSPSINDSELTKRDTVIDTIPFKVPTPVDSVVLRYETVKLPLLEEERIKRTDSIITRDSVYAIIPISQTEYRDSAYHAWVSGFNARLDSIYVFPKTITETHKIREPPKRWGLGIQVGAGYCGDVKFRPYIGIGISYNILTW